MKRQLIQLSPSTSVVSLPAAWIRKNNLKKGAELDVEEKENAIVVSGRTQQREKSIEIDVSGLDHELLWAYIDACYVAGYDTITIRTKDQGQGTYLSKVVRYFPGMMIYDERKNMVQFQDITQEAREDVDKILQRVFNMNISMIEDCMSALEKKEWETFSNAKRIDYNINSYISYCQRMLNNHGYHDFQKTGLMHTYLKLIEMLSDKICDLFTAVGERKAKVEKKDLQKLLISYREVERLHNAFSLAKTQDFETRRQSLAFAEIKDILYDIEELEMQLHV